MSWFMWRFVSSHPRSGLESGFSRFLVSNFGFCSSQLNVIMSFALPDLLLLIFCSSCYVFLSSFGFEFSIDYDSSFLDHIHWNDLVFVTDLKTFQDSAIKVQQRQDEEYENKHGKVHIECLAKNWDLIQIPRNGLLKLCVLGTMRT